MSISTQFDNSYSLTTTDATQTVLATVGINYDNSCNVELNIMARDSSGNTALWRKAVCVKRITDGNIAVISSVLDIVSPQKDLAAALWDVSVVADGSNLVVKVTGCLLTTIYWGVDGKVYGYRHTLRLTEATPYVSIGNLVAKQ